MAKLIIESLDDLMSNRIEEIKGFLEPIIPSNYLDPRRGMVWIEPINQSQKIIFSVNSRGNDPDNYEDRRFPINGRDLTAAYYEIWVPAPESVKLYYLERSYFHLYKWEMTVDDIIETSFVYMHCDPNEEDVTHIKYKKTPHLHILQHDSTLTHAHIAIHLHKQEEVLTDRASITKAIAEGLEMLYNQLVTLA